MKISLSLLIISTFTCLTTQASLRPYKVVVDPGHGGEDTGAVVGQVKESEIALQVSKALKKVLDDDKRFSVHMTRQTDVAVDLKDRVAQADRFDAALFLSIHANASLDRRARGAEFYFQNQLPPDQDALLRAALENQNQPQSGAETSHTAASDLEAIVKDLRRDQQIVHSHLLAKTLAQTWGKDLSPIDHNSVRQAPFFVVTRNQRPSILIELGFLTHPREAEKLAQKSYQKQIAQRIYLSLVKYLENSGQIPRTSLD